MTASTGNRTPMIRVKELRKSFPIFSGILLRRKIGEVIAVDDVSFDIYPGEVVGCVGETGSGKSTLGRLILNLIRPDGGEVWLNDRRIDELSQSDMRPVRRDLQIVFQDPLHALNPRRTVAENVARPLLNFGVTRSGALDRVEELLEIVGLNPAHANRYPHEFSGGQCQRVGIARALALNPKFLFLDEPVSALDVSVQAQILNLLKELQEKLNLTYLFVTHDLKIVKHISDRIMVLYHGRTVEIGNNDDIYVNPVHPYSRALLDSVLSIEGGDSWERVALRGKDDIDDATRTEESATVTRRGCIYSDICPERFEPCRAHSPRLSTINPGHLAACHLHDASLATSREGWWKRSASHQEGRG
jgi:oligopeptide/dipeptide ABC transporter ATP-binding protein